MKPTKIAVLELSKESATLITAEGVFKFQKTQIARFSFVLSILSSNAQF
jgi:hypothetical protein